MSPPDRLPRALVTGAGVLSAAWLAVWLASPPRGATLTLVASGAPARVTRVAPFELDPAPARPPTTTCLARWNGVWDVPADADYVIAARAKGGVTVTIDGRDVVAGERGNRRQGEPRRLSAGLHAIAVERASDCAAGAPRLAWGRAGEALGGFDRADVYPDPPSRWRRAAVRAERVLARCALALWLLAALVLLVPVGARWLRSGRGPSLADVPEAPAWLRPMAARWTRPAAALAAGLVTVYGAALRFEALVVGYWRDGPAWALRAAALVRRWRPHLLEWPSHDGFEGDPFSYLRFAREMTGFYDAHVREPLFVFTTRLLLALTGGRDVAVGLASALFSSLTVPAIYLLGARAFSPLVGLGAALLYAIEPRVVQLSAEGWRDDAFTLFVLLTAWALVGVRERPTRARALLLGVAGAAACLTRITSLSFLVPGYAALLLEGDAAARRSRARSAALAIGVTIVLVGPYLASCAVAFGDPLYSINAHTRFYRARQDLASTVPMSWLTYLSTTLRPFELLDDMLVGLTSYPFASKWEQFGFWAGFLPAVLPPLAIVGLVLLATQRVGRLLLVVLFASLLPYAFTWRVPGGAEWRFTLHAYPFYLLAAVLCAVEAASLLPLPRARLALSRLRWRRVAAAGLVVAAGWWAWNALYYLRLREAVRARRAVPFDAGPRDALYFGAGWYRPFATPNARVRCAHGRHAELALPLEAGRGYALAVRMDPLATADETPQTVAVSLNGVPLGTLSLVRDPRRVGSYALRVPAAATVDGRNRLAFDAAWSRAAGAAGAAQGVPAEWETSFLLWYVTVAPD